ncbi:MAG: hypothetical protein JAY67_15575 [Candidatus Thiodiazotropha taylori]|nr:hypothetical protein [Candidatus Thiodiazotropha taylori]
MRKSKYLKTEIFKSPEWWTSIAVNILTLKLDGIAIDLSKTLKIKDSDIEQELTMIYMEAFKRFSEDNDLVPISENRLEKEYSFNNFDPNFPTWHDMFNDLYGELIANNLSVSKDDVINSLPILFGNYFNRIRTNKKFEKANHYINLLSNNYDSTDGKIVSHINSILNLVGKEPLPIDKSLNLWSIYVTPKAIYWSDDKKERTKKEIKELKEIEHSGKISEKTTGVQYKGKEYVGASLAQSIIGSILNVIDTSTSPIIIHGQPGHGKTSTIRMLTHAIISKEENINVNKKIILLYEFKNLSRLDENAIEILRKHTPFITNEDFFKDKNTIMLLDGIDERQVTEGSDVHLKDFLRNLFILSERVNGNLNTRLNIVITGRTQFIGLVKASFVSDYHEYEIVDFDSRQIDKWLKKYCSLKHISPQLTQSDLYGHKLGNLIHQPILLTISSAMLTDETGRKLIGSIDKSNISRLKIYQTITKWSYMKQWQSQPNRSSLPSEDIYINFLRLIAFILFSSGSEQIKISALIRELNTLVKTLEIDGLQNKNSETLENMCRTIAVLFFFEGLSENSFSFIHKSIKDYLIVEAIFNLLVDAASIFNIDKKSKTCDQMAQDIYFILGRKPLSSEDHVPFLKDLIVERKDESRHLFVALLHFFKKCKTHDYLIKHENNLNDNPLITEANVLSSLYYFLSNIFISLDGNEKTILRLGDKLPIFSNNDDLKCFQHLINAVDPSRCNKHDFNYLMLELTPAGLREAKYA